ncbi:hypothetical protein M0R45_006004 [Rubus argutus]|uniref:Uncharacterized protein n=1 Tax=Rubus argutus TaxID=59490 RepID=A0AAW1YPN7_RUBAR
MRIIFCSVPPWSMSAPIDLDPEHEDHCGVQCRCGQPNLVGDVLCLFWDWFDGPASCDAPIPVLMHRPPALYVEADHLEPQHALPQPVALLQVVAGWFDWFNWVLSIAVQTVAGSFMIENFYWAITVVLEIVITYLELEMVRVQELDELWALVASSWVLLSMGMLAISMMIFVRDMKLDSPSPLTILGIIEVVIYILNMAFLIAGYGIGSASERFLARVLIVATIRILWRVDVRITIGDH